MNAIIGTITGAKWRCVRCGELAQIVTFVRVNAQLSEAVCEVCAPPQSETRAL